MDYEANYWTWRLSDLSSNISSYLNAKTAPTRWATKLDALTWIEMFFVDSERFLAQTKLYSWCQWPVVARNPSVSNGMVTEVISDRAYGMIIAHADMVQRYFADSIPLRGAVADRSLTLAQSFDYRTKNSVKVLESFLATDVTKTELTGLLKQYVDTLHSRIAISNDVYIKSKWEAYVGKLDALHVYIYNAYWFAFRLIPPTVNDTILNALQLMGYSRQHRNDTANIDECFALMSVGHEDTVMCLVEQYYGRYLLAMQDLMLSISNAFQLYDDAVSELYDNLVQSAALNNITEYFLVDNFIKMDIFYKELSHRTIVTQVGFDAPSLISEIGSLMGLLLGASLLTACELVDFLSLLVIVRCAMRRLKSSWSPAGASTDLNSASSTTTTTSSSSSSSSNDMAGRSDN